ncbi:hypothetical protein R1flu_004966 [Riccia fluitans]|uniref:Uncharacterized protein n=1 Tax=Riccia fluitans TaxID=41844 RepID=A0ABD1YVS8_9MARC
MFYSGSSARSSIKKGKVTTVQKLLETPQGRIGLYTATVGGSGPRFTVGTVTVQKELDKRGVFQLQVQSLNDD